MITVRALTPRDLMRALLFWALLIPLALLALLGAEVTRLDLVDTVNTLVYGMGALLALALAGQAAPAATADTPAQADPFGRLFWLVAAGFCAIFVLSELGGDVIEHVEARLQPAWLGDLLCWIAAGAFLLAVARLRPRQMGLAKIAAPVIGLLGAGYALQSAALGLDIGESRLLHQTGLDAATYDNLSDFIEFAFLQLYLLALIGLATELSAGHALRAQIAKVETIEDPVACLRAAQLAFATAAFNSQKLDRNRFFRAATNLLKGSGIGGIINAVKITRKLGPSIKRRSGKSLLRQFAEQMRFMTRHGLAPKSYYLFELFEPAHGHQAAQYLQRQEAKGAAYKIMHRATGQRLSEKLAFHNRCQALGLNVVPAIFAATRGAADRQFQSVTELPARDLFVKPRKGRGGRGAAIWRFVPDTAGGGHFAHKDGTQLTPAALRQRVIDQSRRETMLVQPVLVNHTDFAEVNCGALATIRIVTCRNESGFYEVTDASFRMPKVIGSAVDNFHAGGIAATVEIATGRLGPATDLGLNPHSTWFARHPVTGGQIEGRTLPCWQEARDLVQHAHPHFSDFAVIGWDIAILADGPCIIEANGAPDIDLIQRPARRPIGSARLGQLMAWHVRRDLRRALLDEAT